MLRSNGQMTGGGLAEAVGWRWCDTENPISFLTVPCSYLTQCNEHYCVQLTFLDLPGFS